MYILTSMNLHISVLIIAIAHLQLYAANAAQIKVFLSGNKKDAAVLLDCESKDEIAEANVQWNYTNQYGVMKQLAETTQAIEISSTSTASVGEYRCYKNGTLKNHFTVGYVGEPTVQNTRESVTFNNGDTNRKLVCMCGTDCYPAVQYTWQYRDENESSMYGSINNSSIKEFGIQVNTTFHPSYESSSAIIFPNLTYDLRGYYQCMVNNSGGSMGVEIHVRVKDRLAALWPFLGIVTEVVILICIIFLYERQSKKKNAEEMVHDAKKESSVPLKENEKRHDEQDLHKRSNNNYK